MKKSIGLVFPAVVLLTVLVNGCAPASLPTSVPPSSTFTPGPRTETPFPTSTPTKPPTVTITPTIKPPAAIMDFLTDVKVLAYESFDKVNYSSWDGDQIGNLTNGIFELKGISFWHSFLSPHERFVDGDGIILKFKLQNANGESAFTFDTGVYETDSDKGFGIYNFKHPQIALLQGKSRLDESTLRGNLSLETDTWYNLLMAIGKDEKLLAVIWEPVNEPRRVVYNTTMGEDWSGRSWVFYVRANESETVYIDEFYRISFGEIK